MRPENSERPARGRRRSGIAVVLIALAAWAPLGVAAAGAAGLREPTVVVGNGETLEVMVGGSLTIKAPWFLNRASVADVEVANIEVLEPDQVLIIGLKIGTTDVVLWGENGEIWRRRVVVVMDLPKLQNQLSAVFPDCKLNLSMTENVLVISGTLQRDEQAEQLAKFMEALELKYVDMTSLPGLQQVQIQVRVAEVNRVAIRNLGINAFQVDDSIISASLIGPAVGGAINPVNVGVVENTLALQKLPFVFTEEVNVSPLVSVLAAFPKSDLEFFIQALAENQYLRVLAEPNLVALSGEEATFLAGGEFPIPIVQGTSAGGGTTITIEYKEFGVNLKFRPTVIGDDTIRLSVAPEVSDLSNVGAVEIEGFRIPSVLTRRSQTTLELKSGQTFAMAGLLNYNVNARKSRVPLFGDLPIIGPLFRSTSFQTGESELVILVTAKLVEPLTGVESAPVPGDKDIRPNNWEFYVEGLLEGRPKKEAAEGGATAGAEAAEEQSLGELKGPGGWANHNRR